jgi:hypothetical protein
MRSVTLLALTTALLLGAVALSRHPAPSSIRVAVESRNPWTALPDESDAGRFQFAIVSDRTGGHRPKIFSRAVEQINLLNPSFVVSVGDLIEGSPDEAVNRRQWAEFNGYVQRLRMPFFYAPGNHDRGSMAKNAVWSEQFGRSSYHFVYRGVLFLILDAYDHADEPKGSLTQVRFGPQQIEAVRTALEQNPQARWTFVMLHPPIWAQSRIPEGFLAIEKLLADRPYTVFAGHRHTYRKYRRHDRDYFQLATTGGGSALRGQDYGEFDQIVWVTMRTGQKPTIANLLLPEVLTDELQLPASDEGGNTRPPAVRWPVRGVVYLDGTPLNGAEVRFTGASGGNARTRADGSFEFTSPEGVRSGLAAGRHVATVLPAQPIIGAERLPELGIPARYQSEQTSPLVIEIQPEMVNDLRLDLTSGS